MPGPNSKKSKQSRFPVARIKKIMQMDEEVGKLASATPVMISKSLECFMQALLNDAVVEANRRGSKKLTAYHLKQTINTNETFDFLREIVSTIPDPTDSHPPQGHPHAHPQDTQAQNDLLPIPKRRGRKPKDQGQGQAGGSGTGSGTGGGGIRGAQEDTSLPETKVGGLPNIGTWKRDMTGGGGSGEGGRGMYDDYDVDEDDY